jgi:excisionase family DNA binding protein
MSKQEKESSRNWFDTKEEADAFYEQIRQERQAVKPVQRIRMLSADEVAATLGICDKTVYKMAERNEIPSHRIGGSVKFHPDDVDDYIFLSKYAPSNMQIRPSDKNELFQRMDERFDQWKVCLEGLIKRNQKGVAMRK